MYKPDYQGSSIVNLMTSVIEAMGGENPPYPPLSALDAGTLKASRNIILLVIDGLGYEYLRAKDAHSMLRLHVRARMDSVFPPTTATAVTTFLTGLAPQQHGLTGWFTYFKELGSVLAVLPFCARHGGAPLRDAGIDAASLFEHTPVFDRIEERSYIVTPKRLADSDFTLAHSGRAQIRGYTSLDQMFKEIGDVLHENERRKYIYAYWPMLDGLAHAHGIESLEVAQHFEELDHAVRRVVAEIDGSDTTLIVTADHGLVDCGPNCQIELNDYPDLVDTLVLPLCGDRRLAYCYVRAGSERRFEELVHSELGDRTDVFLSEELIAQGFFGLGRPHPRLRERVGNYALVMKENYTIKDSLVGERRFVHIGSHGGTSAQEVHVPLIVVQV